MTTKDGRIVKLEPHNFIPWDQMTGIQKCITIAGSQRKVAEFLGVSQQTVSEMEAKGYAPTKHIVPLESEYGVPRQELIDPRLRDLLLRE